MSVRLSNGSVTEDDLRLMLLAYGINQPFRVVSLDEIADWLGPHQKEQVRLGLEELSREGLVTRFSGRYCFNRAIPSELRKLVEKAISPSGTIRVAQAAEQG